MSDHDKPLRPVGDEALEARIVAWVLGEASEFEAEELKKRCAREPELALFEARMREIHGLIGESKQVPGEEWRLSDDRRRQVTDLLGSEPPASAKRFRGHHGLLALAACVLVSLMAAPLFRRQAAELKEGRPIIAYSAPTDTRRSGAEGGREVEYRERAHPSPSTAPAQEQPAIVGRATRAGDGVVSRFSVPELLNQPTSGESNEQLDPWAESGPAAAVDEPGLMKDSSLSTLDFGLEDPGGSLMDSIQPPEAASYGGFAFTPEDRGTRRNLDFAGGQFELGDFEGAKNRYLKILEADPRNTVAQRGLERAEAASSSYYRAAYDSTRAELLAEVDKAWSLDVMPAAEGADLAQLREEVAEQEDLVEEKRQALTALARTEHMPYTQGRAAGEGGAETDNALRDAERYAKLEAERIQLGSQLETLARYDGDQLETYASGLNVPENTVRGLEPQLREAETRLAALEAAGLAADSPDVRLQAATVENLQQQMQGGVRDLRESMVDRLDRLQTEAQQLEGAVEKSDAVTMGIARRSFDDARADLATEQQKLEELRLKAVASGMLAPAKPAVDPAMASRALDLMEEVPAEKEPFSTFSLHVGDASFKVAAAAIERGEAPAAESIRPEEFYNAFDYGDPAPAMGEPVACAIGQCAHPAFPQRNLLRIAVRTGSEGRAAATPLNLTVLVDNSGSMERVDRAGGVREAVRSLSSLLKPGDTVTMAGFARQPRLMADRVDGGDAEKLTRAVMEAPSEGGTNLEEALKLGEELAQRQFAAAAQNRVVLFTDGAANLGDADPESLNEKVEGLRQQGIAFDAAGFGADGMNDRLLERLTRNGNGRYYVVDDASEAGADFANQLAGAFRPAAENMKVQVKFNPARVGQYKLIGFDEHRLKKEDFHDDSVDAAELAAEEAGVALYQVEVLPDGEGEVGEVSVRFRDTLSGSMVERSWTIPYSPEAPSFDQAPPSLQLAGLSALVAEKLRGAPLASAIDFGSMKAVMAEVKQSFGRNPRVMQLERMMNGR